MNNTTNMETETEITKGLQLALWRIRNYVEQRKQSGSWDPSEPDWKRDMVPTFPALNHWFPETRWGKKEERDYLRHNLLMALFGKPIGSQRELCITEHRILKEVLSDNSTYLTRGLADELTEAVQGAYSTAPWEIPATR